MSRIYKFRAWDKENNCWYAPTYAAYKGNLFELFVGFSGDLNANVMSGMQHESLWPDRFELMQYTGLKDKNGVEIYEGDIVDVWSAGSHMVNGVITWGKGSASFFIKGPAPKVIWNLSGGGENYDEERLEVIGNIYENPELLRKEEG